MDAKALYPDAFEDDYWMGAYSYQPIIDAIGKVLIQEDDHDYQGDSFVLYDGDINYRGSGTVFGILVFGWGSCSGCDMLQACGSYEGLQRITDHIEQSVQWMTVDQVLAWIKGGSDRNDWYQHSGEDKAYWKFYKKMCEKFGVEYVGPKGDYGYAD